MPDQPSTSDYEPEPPRPRTIPDDFIWDPPTQSWYAPGEPTNWNQAAFDREVAETIRKVREECIANGTWGNGTVIRLPPLSDVPSASRKSLRTGVKQEHLPLFPDDDIAATKAEPAPCDPDGDEPSEEVC